MLGFMRAHTEGLPEVTLKAAITLDGRIASATGEARWITGPAARELSHRLRDQHDAIVVGVGTVLADDPELTTRIPGGRDAVPVLLDSTLRTPVNAAVLRRDTALVYCADDAPPRELPGASVIRLPRGPAGVDVRTVLRDLAARGLHRVLVDGGAKVHRSFLDGGHADRLELFVNARVLAGGPGFVAGPGYALAAAPSFVIDTVERVGDDLRIGLERG
jgi:diaminohydroxyphosphoribosylaminopyrimidine deaminase/5-amino-6-(5-phosphoribosylamino)uracil reductase